MSLDGVTCGQCGERVVFDQLTERELEVSRSGGPLIRPWRHVDAGTRVCYPACEVCGERPALWALGTTVADGGGGTRFQVRAHRCQQHRGADGILRL